MRLNKVLVPASAIAAMIPSEKKIAAGGSTFVLKKQLGAVLLPSPTPLPSRPRGANDTGTAGCVLVRFAFRWWRKRENERERYEVSAGSASFLAKLDYGSNTGSDTSFFAEG